MKRTLVFGIVLMVALVLPAAIGLPAAMAQGFDGDRVVLGENYTLRSGEVLDGNLAVLGGTAQIEADATVRGDVTVAGGVLTVDGRITGNVSLLGGTVRLDETAVIEGDLASFAGSVEQAPGAEVQGDSFSGLRTPSRVDPVPVIPDLPGSETTPRNWLSRFLSWQLGTIGSILLMGLLGIVLVLVAPRAVGRVASATAIQPALTFGVGFLTLAVGTLAGAILLIACGLGLLVWLALIAAGILGWIGVALWLGQRMLRALRLHTASATGEVLAGVVAITLLARLPWCFGWLAWLIFISWGLGAVVVTRFGTQDAQGPSSTMARLPAMEAESGMGGPVASTDVSESIESLERGEMPLLDEPPAVIQPSDVTIEPSSGDVNDNPPPPAEPDPRL